MWNVGRSSECNELLLIGDRRVCGVLEQILATDWPLGETEYHSHYHFSALVYQL